MTPTSMPSTERRGDWISTVSGLPFWPMDPHPSDVRIEDIAHALSHLCRFAGHTRAFYCVTPEMRVLTSDLRWRPAGELCVGDALFGFDEMPAKVHKNRNRRRIRPSIVTAAARVYRPVYRLRLADGTDLRCSAEHPWLVATKQSRNQRWMTTEAIAKDVRTGRLRSLHRFLKPWETETGHGSGYLAGIFDGEGHVSFGQSVNGTLTLGIAQNAGVVLDRIHELLTEHDVRFTTRQNPQSSTYNVSIRGAWRDRVAAIGRVRATRLINRLWQAVMSGRSAPELQGHEVVAVTSASFQGEQPVAALETSTHTYFCEGFGAHNSVAQHALLVSLLCPYQDALWGLLHDASEAYVCDLPRPLKHTDALADYRAIEDTVQRAVCLKFGLPIEMPPSVKAADTVLLRTEQRDLMTMPEGWTPKGPLAWQTQRITPMAPAEAKQRFLWRFEELMRRGR